LFGQRNPQCEVDEISADTLAEVLEDDWDRLTCGHPHPWLLRVLGIEHEEGAQRFRTILASVIASSQTNEGSKST
jgi:hypothetical protein